MDEKEHSRNQLLQDLFSEIDHALFDPELARIIADSLENENVDYKKPIGRVIIIPRLRLNISRETLLAYTADLQSIQTAIIAEHIQGEIIDECLEKNENVQDDKSAGAKGIKKVDDSSDAFEMVKDDLTEDESLEDDNSAVVNCSQNIRGGAEVPEGTEDGDRTETGDAIASNDGVEMEDFFTIRYLNPEKPEDGVLYIVAEFTLEETIMVARFPWVARLEMPREYYVELKG